MEALKTCSRSLGKQYVAHASPQSIVARRFAELCFFASLRNLAPSPI